jgi:hypothetical protein
VYSVERSTLVNAPRVDGARFTIGWPFAVAALFATLVTIYIYLAMWRYAIFRAGVDDCIFTQIVNGAFNGFSSTVEGSVNHFRVHFSPVLYLAAKAHTTNYGAFGFSIPAATSSTSHIRRPEIGWMLCAGYLTGSIGP